MQELPAALRGLCAFRQFIVYKLEPSASRAGKWDKFPCSPHSGIYPVSAHDSQYWLDATTAMQIAGSWGEGYGVGFVFTEAAGFWFLDVDNCLLNSGEWSPIAQQLCAYLAGCAVEISQSGKGLHFFGRGSLPEHGCRNAEYGLELYSAGRFVALTGTQAAGDCTADASALMPALVEAYFPTGATRVDAGGWTTGPDPDWVGPADDTDLIRRALQSKSADSAFGSKASFADLWFADERALGATYPDKFADRGYDASLADVALAQHLAFWTGRDCERIQRLMMQSKLVRDKWDREDYLPRTITKAAGRQEDVLKDKRVEPSAMTVTIGEDAPIVSQRGGPGFLSAEDQLTHFKGCIYIDQLNSVFCGDGIIRTADRFRVKYGGYQFHMDAANEKVSSDAWEAFTLSRIHVPPQVFGTCFKPAEPTGSIIIVDGQSFVNTYVPVDVPRMQGDVSPFLRHLELVLPNLTDRAIFLSYMAACVQYKGTKFQWAPLLQGVEGNGKTLFSRCVARAIGKRYSHFPPASEISEKFNSWLADKIFIGVEDIYVPNQKQEVFEILKPMITSERMAIRKMRTDQEMRDVCSNFIFNSNHQDGIIKTRNDRRICTLFCAQQQESDLARDGMSGDYMPNLYKWLDGDGYALVSEYLHTYAIAAEYNPAGSCHKAPRTTSTDDAISYGLGIVEQEINESIAQELQGFCGGWISSIWLDRMLERIHKGRNLSHSKRKEILAGMGFFYHPALTQGQVNNKVLPDNGKPRLYIRRDTMAWQITNANEAAKSYEAANINKQAALPMGNVRNGWPA
jgi:Family of unknown function (DUF5906)